MNLSAWSIKNPIPAVMLFVLLSFAGLLSYQSMKVQQFPDMELPMVTVAASCPAQPRPSWRPKWPASWKTPLPRCKA